MERQQPNGRDSKLPQIVELFGEAAEIADAIAVAVVESADVSFVDDGVLIPEWVGAQIAESGVPSGCSAFSCGLRQCGRGDSTRILLKTLFCPRGKSSIEVK